MKREIIICEHAGFCFGVNRAANEALKIAENSKGPLYTFGPLVHNPQVIEKLKEMGIKEINSVDKVSDGKVIIRAHGVHPKILSDLRKKNIEIIDMTCPFVKNVQKKARELYEHGYQVLILGERDHAEVIGINGYANNKAIIINCPEEAEEIGFFNKIGLISQTTQNKENFYKISSLLMKRCKKFKAFNTICDTTNKRQFSACEMAKKVGCMLVVGGKNSANTTRLAQICGDYTKTYHIETSKELKEQWFENIERIGITGGASTPDWIIKEVVEKVKNCS